MSYTLLVQSEAPLGYWKLNGTWTDYAGSNNATISSSAVTSLPLVANSSSALLVKSGGASVTIPNSYDPLHARFVNKRFSLEFWIAISGFNGSGMTINASSATRYFVNNQLKIVKLMNGSTEVGNVRYDYNKNTIRFSINSSSGSNTDAYFPVRNLNTVMHVVASYVDGTLSLVVNGDIGTPGYVSDTSLFPARGTSNYNFVIDSTSINSSSVQFVISDLAMYDYALPMDSIRKRIVWAHHNDKPTYLTNHINTSLFNIVEKPSQVLKVYEIIGNRFKINDYYSVMNIDEDEGLAPIKMDYPSIDYSSSNSASVSFSSSGAQMYNYGAVSVLNFLKYMSNNNIYTFTAQVVKGSASSDHLFSIYDNATDSVISARVENAGFTVYYYNKDTASSTAILSASTTLSTGSSYNLGVCFNAGSAFIYANGVSASSTMTPILLSNNPELKIGNMFSAPSISNTSLIKNFGFSNILINNFSTVDFTKNAMFMLRLTSDMSISQVGNWVMNLPLSMFGAHATASKITWDGADNCLVEVSSNSGSTWTTAYRSKQVPGFKANIINPDLKVRVTMPYDYGLEQHNQSFNNLDITVYQHTSFFSEDNTYELIPQSTDQYVPSYNIQRNIQPITYRKDNFGLKFEDSGSGVAGYAIIRNVSQALQPSAIDFWFRADALSNTTNQYLIDVDNYYPDYALGDLYIDQYQDQYGVFNTSVTPQEYESDSLYIDATTKKLIYQPSGGTTLYVNGSPYSSSAFTVVPGEFYHILFDFGTRVNLLSNPSFETNTSGWNTNGTGTSITRITSDRYSGAYSLQITASVTGAGVYTPLGVNAITVQSGQTYTFSMYAKCAPAYASANVSANIVYYDVSGTYIGQVNSVSAISNASWTRVSSSVALPANAVYAAPYFYTAAPTSSIVFYIDAGLFEQSPLLETYFEGTINRSISPSATIYLNSNYQSPSGTHIQGSYGYVNIWNNDITSSTASSRYQSYIGNNIVVITDATSPPWQPSWSSDSITSASGIKIGATV